MKKGSGIIIVYAEREEKDDLGIILFLSILLSLLPIFFSATIIPELPYSILYQVIVGGIFLIQTVILFFYFLVYTKKIVDERLFLFAWVFMISQIITLFISSLTNIQINYFDFINVFARFLCVFIFLCIPSRLSISKKGLENFMISIVLLGCVAGIYNIIINFNGMINILNINNPYAVNFKSFYLNRNSFGQLLFFSVIANTFLWIEKRSLFRWLSYLIFGINIFAILSRTVIASVSIFLLIFFNVYCRKKKGTCTVILIFVVGLFLLANSNKEISHFISSMLIRKNVGISGRSDLWVIGLQILNKTNWIFGAGYITSIDFIGNMGYSLSEFHNFYIETLVGGGLVDLLLHLVILIFAFRKAMNIYKNDKKTGMIYFSSYIAFLFYAFFESASFFSMGYVGSIFTIFFITIPLLYSNNINIMNPRCFKAEETSCEI